MKRTSDLKKVRKATVPSNGLRPFERQGFYVALDVVLFERVMPRLTGDAWKALSAFLAQDPGAGFDVAGLARATGLRSVDDAARAITELGEMLVDLGSPSLPVYVLNPDFEVSTAEGR